MTPAAYPIWFRAMVGTLVLGGGVALVAWGSWHLWAIFICAVSRCCS